MSNPSRVFVKCVNMKISFMNVLNHVSASTQCGKEVFFSMCSHDHIMETVQEFILSLGFPKSSAPFVSLCQIIIQCLCANIVKTNFNNIQIGINKEVFTESIFLYIFSIVKRIDEIINNINSVIIDTIFSQEQMVVELETRLVDENVKFINTYYNLLTCLSDTDVSSLQHNILFLNFSEIIGKNYSSLFLSDEGIVNILATINPDKKNYIIDMIINNNNVIESVTKFNKTIKKLNDNIEL